MTTLNAPDIDGTETEYQEFPLEASATDDSVSYGSHLVPLQSFGDLDLPQLLTQTVKSEELPGADSWEK